MEFEELLEEGSNGDGGSERRGTEGESLRARSEQALGELAQALIDNPTLHNAITAALGAREKAIEAQHAAFQALNLPSAGDVERLERRVRGLSGRLEEVEEQLDESNRDLTMARRQLGRQAGEAADRAGAAEEAVIEARSRAEAAERAVARADQRATALEEAVRDAQDRAEAAERAVLTTRAEAPAKGVGKTPKSRKKTSKKSQTNPKVEG